MKSGSHSLVRKIRRALRRVFLVVGETSKFCSLAHENRRLVSMPPTKPTHPEVHFPGPRVSMDDIARAAGVHRSTVSLALRNQPRIPATTRERILGIAQTLGYAPDPMLDAFNFYRMARLPSRSGGVIAFVSDHHSRETVMTSPRHLSAYKGAKTRAAELGLGIELFCIHPGPHGGARLARVLQARNITCVIVALLDPSTTQIAWDWSRYCSIALESFQLDPPVDSLTTDHRRATRIQFHRLRAAGHRRIGFVSTQSEDNRLQGLPRSGYLLEGTHSHSSAIPPLLLESANALGAFRDWMKKYQPTAAVGGCALTLAAAQTGRTLDTLWCGPGNDALQLEYAALLRQYCAIGARAVELLALRLQTNQRGLPESRTTIELPLETPVQFPR